MKIYKIGFLARTKKLLIKWRKVKSAKWVRQNELLRRSYKSYEDYVSHQGSKLSLLNLSDYDEKYRLALIDRYRNEKARIAGRNVLCLGARTGSECKAFITLGAFCVGIDLNPGMANKNVLVGDFHNIQFSDGSVDFVYTNALDHSFDLHKVISEVKRVLKAGGIFYAEIVKGDKDPNGRKAGDFESIWWDTCNAIALKIEGLGFKKIEFEDFSFPWNGTKFVFEKI